MSEILRRLWAEAAFDPVSVPARLLAAWLAGYAVAFVYRRSRPAAAVLPSFPATLVMLSVLIAMVTQVIGDNVARAFSLVGALSIVRFRTVVRDTQDTAYVIFAVAVGMAVGAGHAWVAVAGIPVIAAAAALMRDRGGTGMTAPTHLVRARIPLGADPETFLGPTLDAHLLGRHLTEIATSRQGLALDVAYTGTVRAETAAGELVRGLNRLEGVQSVSLERLASAEG